MNSLKLNRSDVELMAPVGSYESLMAAIQGKANSVYFGIGKLNMRSKSTNNFTVDDLEKIVAICNENGMQAYVTVNTVVYDDDVQEMKATIDACKKFKVHAIIASDIAALNYAKSIGVEVHISTQQNISNTEAVRFFSQYADVVVLARELNLNQVKAISDAIAVEKIVGLKGNPVKIEMFAHGALCMAVSGKCYLSLHEYNQSANRGGCLQICRRAYTVTDKETNAQLEIDNEYIMSPKDLCTIGFIDKLLLAGVRVLKLEGRARSAEYVKTVAECYNEAIDAYCDGSYSQEKIDAWMDKLSTVYNRGYWDGYYLGRKLGEWSSIYGSKATKKKIYIGKCLNYFSNIKVAEFVVETNSIKSGDEMLIIGPSTGVIESLVPEIRVDLVTAEEAVKGQKFSIMIDKVVRRSDKLYKLIEDTGF
jgi:putative protease